MKNRVLKTGCMVIASIVCITLITFAESPPPVPPQGPTGWYWTGEVVGCQFPEGPCIGSWDNPSNWEFRGLSHPTWDYPQEPSDDAYLTWADAYPLILYLTTEEIDSLDIHGNAEGPTQSLTFEGNGSPKTLSCNHITFKAIDGPFLVTVADHATIRTVD